MAVCIINNYIQVKWNASILEASDGLFGTWNVYVIVHSHDAIRFSHTLVCKILSSYYSKYCKIQILGETNDSSIAENNLKICVLHVD